MAPGRVGVGGSVDVTSKGVGVRTHVGVKKSTVDVGWKPSGGKTRNVRTLSPEERREIVLNARKAENNGERPSKSLSNRSGKKVKPRLTVSAKPGNRSQKGAGIDVTLPDRGEIRKAGEEILDNLFKSSAERQDSSSRNAKSSKETYPKAKIQVSAKRHSSKPSRQELPSALRGATQLPGRAAHFARDGVRKFADDLTGVRDRRRLPAFDDDSSDTTSTSSFSDDDWDTRSLSSTSTEASDISELSDVSDDVLDDGYGTNFDSPHRLDEPDSDYSEDEEDDALSEASKAASSGVSEDDLKSKESDEFLEKLEKTQSGLSKLWGFIKRNKATILLGIGIFIGVAACVGIGLASGGIGLGLGLIAAGGFFLGAGLGMMMAADDGIVQQSQSPQPPATDQPKPASSKSEGSSEKPKEVTGKSVADDAESSEANSTADDKTQSKKDEQKRSLQKRLADDAQQKKLRKVEDGNDADDERQSLSDTESDSTDIEIAERNRAEEERYNKKLEKNKSTIGTNTDSDTDDESFIVIDEDENEEEFSPSPSREELQASFGIPSVAESGRKYKESIKKIQISFSDKEKKAILEDHFLLSKGADERESKLRFLLKAVIADIALNTPGRLNDAESSEMERALLTEIRDNGLPSKRYDSARFAGKLKNYKFSNKQIGVYLADVEKRARAQGK